MIDAEIIAAIRQATSDTALRASLETYGWVEDLPAIQDERGLTLVGNRRLRLAEELGIKPVIRKVTFGKGEAAEAERFKLAFVSNIGGVSLAPKDRKRIAIYLYVERGWRPMERIGEALGVSKVMVHKYLADIVNPVNNVKEERGTDSLGRKKSTGRPKGSKAKQVHRNKAITPDAEQEVAKKVLDEGLSLKDAAKAEGIGSEQVAKVAVAKERGRRAAIEAGEGMDFEAYLSMSAQEKLNAAIRLRTRKLEIEYAQRRSAEVEQHIKDYVIPHTQKKLDEADRIIKARRGVMTRAVYRKIWSCLHPDRLAAFGNTDPDMAKRYGEAFDLFSKLEIVLCNEKEMATEPVNLADRIRAAKAARDAKRAAARSNIRRR